MYILNNIKDTKTGNNLFNCKIGLNHIMNERMIQNNYFHYMNVNKFSYNNRPLQEVQKYNKIKFKKSNHNTNTKTFKIKGILLQKAYRFYY